MSAAAVDALFAQVTAGPTPVVCLAELDRRPEGEDFPTVPVGALELDVNEVAAALFESETDAFAVPVPSTDTLYKALKASVATLGPAGLVDVSRTFEGLPEDEFPEVRACRTFAYRLALSFWYEGARARPMTAGELGVALYLSDLHRYLRDAWYQVPRRELMLSRALHQGVTAVPTESLIRLGAVMSAELAGPAKERQREREWLYKQALPDYHRRRFCFDAIRGMRVQPAPLIVRFDSGGYTIGLTPPPGPGGMWQRSTRAEW
ncbi:hypothetical protein OIE71_24700 [Streptomyces sp. NBC_01725]|uniref:hypothetical protein n=1 Tax=Streptomyces sp. NBC_01725 TaxID=2975923 RepID=UPI002E2C2175|nr:hypothetical protein [Streptomyces sp. NBC_01725]